MLDALKTDDINVVTTYLLDLYTAGNLQVEDLTLQHEGKSGLWWLAKKHHKRGRNFNHTYYLICRDFLGNPALPQALMAQATSGKDKGKSALYWHAKDASRAPLLFMSALSVIGQAGVSIEDDLLQALCAQPSPLPFIVKLRKPDLLLVLCATVDLGRLGNPLPDRIAQWLPDGFRYMNPLHNVNLPARWNELIAALPPRLAALSVTTLRVLQSNSKKIIVSYLLNLYLSGELTVEDLTLQYEGKSGLWWLAKKHTEGDQQFDPIYYQICHDFLGKRKFSSVLSQALMAQAKEGRDQGKSALYWNAEGAKQVPELFVCAMFAINNFLSSAPDQEEAVVQALCAEPSPLPLIVATFKKNPGPLLVLCEKINLGRLSSAIRQQNRASLLMIVAEGLTDDDLFIREWEDLFSVWEKLITVLPVTELIGFQVLHHVVKMAKLDNKSSDPLRCLANRILNHLKEAEKYPEDACKAALYQLAMADKKYADLFREFLDVMLGSSPQEEVMRWFLAESRLSSMVRAAIITGTDKHYHVIPSNAVHLRALRALCEKIDHDLLSKALIQMRCGSLRELVAVGISADTETPPVLSPVWDRLMEALPVAELATDESTELLRTTAGIYSSSYFFTILWLKIKDGFPAQALLVEEEGTESLLKKLTTAACNEKKPDLFLLIWEKIKDEVSLATLVKPNNWKHSILSLLMDIKDDPRIYEIIIHILYQMPGVISENAYNELVNKGIKTVEFFRARNDLFKYFDTTPSREYKQTLSSTSYYQEACVEWAIQCISSNEFRHALEWTAKVSDEVIRQILIQEIAASYGSEVPAVMIEDVELYLAFFEYSKQKNRDIAQLSKDFSRLKI